jgi:hypothetical protein
MNIFVVTIALLALALCLYLGFWVGMVKGFVGIINACKLPVTPNKPVAIGLGRFIVGSIILCFTGFGLTPAFGGVLIILSQIN